jgi:D-aminoacyl-tRNA deacylase
MRAVLQRVRQARVLVDQRVVGQIEAGLLVLLGVELADTEKDLEYLVKKTTQLRIFEDSDGKMNLSMRDIGAKMLVVSQFTLLGNVNHGNRPSFVQAAPPELANAMYDQFVIGARATGLQVETGVFRACMQVELINDGPVTMIIDSRQRFA